MGQLSLSTASSLRLGAGLFDVVRTSPMEAATLRGTPETGATAFPGDPLSLQALGLERYRARLEAEEVDLEVLPQLSHDELALLGIDSPGAPPE